MRIDWYSFMNSNPNYFFALIYCNNHILTSFLD